MVNQGSLICSNLNPICVDLSQLRHLSHLSNLRHVIYVIYVSVFNFTSPLRGCGAAHRDLLFSDKISSLDLLDMYVANLVVLGRYFVQLGHKMT